MLPVIGSLTLADVAARRQRRRDRARGLFSWRPGSLALTTSPSLVRTYIDASGIVRTVASGVVRDADYSTGQRGMLVESERTNEVTNSTSSGGWTVALGAVATPNAVLGPDGVTWAVRISNLQSQPSAQSNRTLVGRALPSLTVAGALWIRCEAGDVGKAVSVEFKRTSGSTYAGSSMEYSLTAQWRRLLLPTFLTAADSVSVTASIRGLAAGADSCLVWLPTIEIAPWASSGILTIDVALTRAADAVSAIGVLPVGIHATRYEHYFDLATNAVVERVVDVPATSGDVVFTNDRAWYALAYDTGVKTLAEMQAVAA